ncbi:MAG: carboxypeptidase-like regulatory domain-containing protein [Fidelibacterota bacterium]
MLPGSRNLLTLTIWMGLCLVPLHSQTRTGIQGVVIDAATQKPLAGADVMIEGTDRGSAADGTGRFLVEGVPPGIYHVRFQMIGYKPLVKLNVQIVPGRLTDIRARLEQEAIELGSVRVTRAYFEKESDVMVSNRSVDQEEIRRDPGGAYDIQRMMQSLPSVVSSSDQQNEIVVRGGLPGENLFLMDNIEIANPNHFGQQGTGGGPINMINPLLIDRVDFMAGAFPARYGNKVSSVMNIELREGNRSHPVFNFDLNMSGAGIVAEGPLRKGHGSYLFSAKRSYLDLVIANTGLTAVPQYWNSQVKLVFNLSPVDKLLFNAIYGRDAIDLVGENDAWSRGAENAIVDGDQSAMGLTYRHLWKGEGVTRVTLAGTRAWFNYDVFRYGPTGKKTGYYYQDDVESDRQLKSDFLWRMNSRVEWRAGVDLKKLTMKNLARMNPDTLWMYGYQYPGSGGAFVPNLSADEWTNTVFPIIAGSDPDSVYLDTSGVYHYSAWSDDGQWRHVAVRSLGVADIQEGYSLDHKKSSLRSSAFLQMKLKNVRGFRFTLGFRVGAFELTGDSWFAPRIGISRNISPVTALNVAYGRHFQVPAMKVLLLDPQNEKLRNKMDDQLVLGLDHYFSEETRATVEIYWKKYRDLPVSLARLTPDSLDESSVYVNRGKAVSQGIEFFLQKKLARDLFGTVSYSHYKALGEDLRFSGEHKVYPLEYDFRNVLNLIGGYKIPFRGPAVRPLNERPWWVRVLGKTIGADADELEISFRYRYVGGKPYTPKSYNWNLRRWYVSAKADMNTDRLPEYQRFDLMILWHVQIKKVTMTSYVDIQNVFNRKNIWDLQYNDDGTTENILQYQVLPVGGVTLEF